MTPSEVSQWQRIIRDFVTLGVGTFMLIYETVAVAVPNEWIIGGGLTALGLVPLFRYDEWRQTNGNGKGNGHEKRSA